MSNATEHRHGLATVIDTGSGGMVRREDIGLRSVAGFVLLEAQSTASVRFRRLERKTGPHRKL